MTPSAPILEPRPSIPPTGGRLPEPVEMAPGEQARLLDLARAAVAAAVGASPAEALAQAVAAGPLPKRPAGAFVTLLEDGRLRGCMGSLDVSVPVWVSVVDAAAWAARSDPRFRTVTPDELASIDLHVSVLGRFVRLADPLALRLGTDGVMLVRGARRGLLLPEVATEAGLDRVALLDACCDKAGLSRGAWRDPGTQVLAFRTLRFGGPAVGEPIGGPPRG